MDSGRSGGHYLIANRARIAARIVEEEFARRPDWFVQYGETRRTRCLEDAELHLSHLGESVASGECGLFTDYLAWAKLLLIGRGIPAEHLARHLETAAEVLERDVPEPLRRPVCDHLRMALEEFTGLPCDAPTLIRPDNPMEELARRYLGYLLGGNRRDACTLILDAVAQNVPVKSLYRHVFEPCLHEIGRMWQMHLITVAQEHFFTAATQLIMAQLYPYVFGGEKGQGVMVMTCVSGELHEIGPRIVADYFEMAGWNAHYLGANTPDSAVVEMLSRRKASLLGISATMTFQLSAVRRLIQAVRDSDKAKHVVILVGGRAFQRIPDLWRTVGADGWAPTADAAIETSQRLAR